ncbi:MAG: hypothetical protein II195_02520, partial [Selenomonadales bacterium]|nr:hypothetical protein [Selenomonadales bacterium]
MSKFDFLEEQYPELYEMCVEVEEGIKPYDKAHKARKVIERITKTFITTPNLSLTKRIDKLRKDGIIKEEMYVRFVV